MDEILNLIESVSEGFPSYSCLSKRPNFSARIYEIWNLDAKFYNFILFCVTFDANYYDFITFWVAISIITFCVFITKFITILLKGLA